VFHTVLVEIRKRREGKGEGSKKKDCVLTIFFYHVEKGGGKRKQLYIMPCGFPSCRGKKEERGKGGGR